MDSPSNDLYSSLEEFQSLEPDNQYFATTTGFSNGISPTNPWNETEFSYDGFFSYLNQLLMEEEYDDNYIHDSSTLKATEKSFSEALGVTSSAQFLRNGNLHRDNVNEKSIEPAHDELPPRLPSMEDYSKSITDNSFDIDYFGRNFIYDAESDEARRLIPEHDLDLQKFGKAAVTKDFMGENLPTISQGVKNHHKEDLDVVEGRATKHSAVFVDNELEHLTDAFGKFMICSDASVPVEECEEKVRQNGNPQRKRKNSKKEKQNKVIDLRNLLTLCAQASSIGDNKTAVDLLTNIRQHSSPFGDGSQRCSYYFAAALEARLHGNRGQIFSNFYSNTQTVSDLLKICHFHMSSCPFKSIAIYFAKFNLLKVSENSSVLHVVDFGISDGFHWPIIIQSLSKRAGGPPRLRITGIEFPQAGHRPAEKVEDTGRFLARFCAQYNVPFEYRSIAQKWETIQVEDLKMESTDAVAVTCFFRFEHLLDESVDVVNSPRDAVMTLIHKIDPHIFVHSVLNGSYGAPFFVTRFREAFFYYSSLFDMLDAVVDRRNEVRLLFENVVYGNEIMNVISCEGYERVVRPEPYRQWQLRSVRSGFKQLPLDEEAVRIFTDKMKDSYHKDFMIEEDGKWLLQGWKGRVMCASSCWVPLPRAALLM